MHLYTYIQQNTATTEMGQKQKKQYTLHLYSCHIFMIQETMPL
jgi:hypothetical protein